MNVETQRASEPKEKDLKLYSIFTGLFVASLLLANVTSQKIFAVGPLALPGGVLIFPVSFIFGDILTEVYGYERSRKVIWIGFVCQTWAAITYLIVGALPPAAFYADQAAYDKVLGFVPRIVAGSIAAYFCGEFCNSYVLSKMKYWSKGKGSQAWRFIASTVVGEAVDTIIIMTIAFAGVLSVPAFIQTALSVYGFKVAYEIVCTPFSTRFANWVKKKEGVDHIDTPENTSYNPLTVLTKA